MYVVFKPEELKTALLPPLDLLMNLGEISTPFLHPVDPEVLGIPDYFDVIQNPIDLNTIKTKLNNGGYLEPWAFVDDVWLMFENAWLYNDPANRVYESCTALSKAFMSNIDPAMISLGYCCGQKYKLQPQIKNCWGDPLCVIQKKDACYAYQDRFTFCKSCFKVKSTDGFLRISEHPVLPEIIIPKTEFVRVKTDERPQVDEPYVACTECERKFHSICVMQLEYKKLDQKFVCDGCRLRVVKKETPEENPWSAKNLKTTKLGDFIEEKVNNWLKIYESTETVCIRVVSSIDKVAEVKPCMKKLFWNSGQLTEKYPYRSKTILAFETIEGVDVCFFGLRVQEYGSSCPGPNTRRIYISYFDSVNYFIPKELRTGVYYEIILAYFEYVKEQGYTTVHIWGCPPAKCDDIIFNCHPEDQKIPTHRMLQEWIKNLIQEGIRRAIVLEYKDILQQTLNDSILSVVNLPYFEGDFWPIALEEATEELMDNDEVLSDADENGILETAGTSRHAYYDRTDPDSVNTLELRLYQVRNNVLQNIRAMMSDYKNSFFVVHLNAPYTLASFKIIQDLDPLISSDVMDSRDAFLKVCCTLNYEFSTLRRAKFASMALLYELHNQSMELFVYTCNNCTKDTALRYHCNVCEDFDLCIDCYPLEHHPHEMVKLGIDIDPAGMDMDMENERPSSSAGSVEKTAYQNHNRTLFEALNCINLKENQEPLEGKVGNTSNGENSEQFNRTSSYYHAKSCTDPNCPKEDCEGMKLKIDKFHEQKLAQQNKFHLRRSEMMKKALSDKNARKKSVHK